MKIAFIAIEFVTEPDLFPGGFGHYLHRAARQLVERGHEVHVITYSQQDNTQLVYDGIIVHRLPSGRLHSLLIKISRGKFPLTCMWLDFSYNTFRLLQRLYSTSSFDILQIPNLHGSGLFSSLLLSIPYVVRISSYAPVLNKLEQNTSYDYRLLAFLEKLQLSISQHLFTPSVRLKNIIEENTKRNDIAVIPSPFYIEIEEFDESVYLKYLAGKPYILFFATRLTGIKGPQILAEALPEIFLRFPKVCVVFVGVDMPYDGQSMRDYILTVCHGFEERILFFDPVSHAQAYPLLQHAQLVVLPSLLENLSNSCLEAMGLGAVVIGTKNSSHEEIIIDGVNGFLSEVGNAEMLRDILAHILAENNCETIKQAAAQDVRKKFSPEYTVTQLETLYRHCIENFRPTILQRLFSKLSQVTILRKCTKKLLRIGSPIL